MPTYVRAWNAAYEAIPPNTQVVSQGAQRIRDLKLDIRERMVTDHVWNDGLTSGSEDGEHKKLTLEVGSAPANLADKVIAYAKDFDPGSGAKASFHIIDEDGTEIRLTQEGVIALLQLRNLWPQSQVTEEDALIDAATVAIDASTSNAFTLLTTAGVGATRALGNPTNGKKGQVITIRIVQDATGSRLVTFGSNWRGNLTDDLTFSTGVNDEDMLVGYCRDGTLWQVLNLKLDINNSGI